MNITPEFYTVVMDQLKVPFEYGTNDCALFVDHIYRKAFGIDLAKEIRGSYNDEYHATKTLVGLGGWDGILLSRGFDKVSNRNYVSRGDIVISSGAAGVWIGSNKAAFAGGVYRTLSDIDTVFTYKG